MAKKKIDPQDIAAATREHPYSLTQNVCTYNIVYDTALQSPFPPEPTRLTFRRVGGQTSNLSMLTKTMPTISSAVRPKAWTIWSFAADL